MKPVMMLLLCLVWVACGDDNNVGLQKKQADAGAIPPGCLAETGDTELRLQDDRRWLPLHELYYQDGEGPQDLCTLFEDNTADYVILQMVSPPCYRCMTWTDELATGLLAAGATDRYQHIVLALDDGDTTTEEWGVIANDVAPGSRWVRDYKRGLWNFFSLEEQKLTEPMTIVFSREARGFFTLDSSLDFPSLQIKIEEILEPSP